jgi:murein DD-endopeptidase MepM/ murein hydrolase activator NlpD
MNSWKAAGLVLSLLEAAVAGPLFRLPTANQALFQPGGEERFFTPTSGKSWTSGQFGCVRSDGHQFHEGIDIQCLSRDRRGEPTDPIQASADGVVAYISRHPGLSNYGNYLVLRHQVDGLEIYTLYAHLSAIRQDLKLGDSVRGGETVATMGRTSNTRQRITKDRAHVHFEIDVVASDRFAAWYAQHEPGQKNDHGNFHGHNLMGVDPAAVLREENRLRGNFNLVRFLQAQPEMCRVTVRAKTFPWIKRYAALIQPNPVASREGIAGYELCLTFNGIPVRVIPRAASELRSPGKFALVSVNPGVHDASPCAGLVRQRDGRWSLTPHGLELLDLLTY